MPTYTHAYNTLMQTQNKASPKTKQTDNHLIIQDDLLPHTYFEYYSQYAQYKEIKSKKDILDKCEARGPL